MSYLVKGCKDTRKRNTLNKFMRNGRFHKRLMKSNCEKQSWALGNSLSPGSLPMPVFLTLHGLQPQICIADMLHSSFLQENVSAHSCTSQYSSLSLCVNMKFKINSLEISNILFPKSMEKIFYGSF